MDARFKNLYFAGTVLLLILADFGILIGLPADKQGIGVFLIPVVEQEGVSTAGGYGSLCFSPLYPRRHTE